MLTWRKSTDIPNSNDEARRDVRDARLRHDRPVLEGPPKSAGRSMGA